MLMTQVLVDAYECGPVIRDETALVQVCHDTAEHVGATIMGDALVRFVPHGLTVALFLAESHLVLTTWPEHELLLIDLLLCNPGMDAEKAATRLAKSLSPDCRLVVHKVQRHIAPQPV